MKRLLFVLLAVSVAVSSAFAEEEKENLFKKVVETAISPIEEVLGGVTELNKIVVTPSRLEEKLGSSSCSVSVVDDVDIGREKFDTAKDALRTQVGLDVVQAGGLQGQTSLFTRGGNSNQTLIMIDGVKAYDPISTNGAYYNLGHLALDNVDRVEILRGPQSALYGSDAVAGVVSIISKKAEKPYVSGYSEAGSLYTYKEGFEMGSKAESFHYSIAGSRLDTKGVSQAEVKNNNQEHDPYDRTNIAARVDYDLGENGTLGGTLRYINAHYEYDGGWPFADDDDLRARLDEIFATLYGRVEIFDWLAQSVRLGWMDTLRRSRAFDSGAPAFLREKYRGKYFKLDAQTDIRPCDFDTIVAGYEYTEEMGDAYYEDAWGVTDTNKVFAREGDLYLENRFNLADRLTSTQGVRVGHHSQAGTFATYRVDASYLAFTGTKIRGLFATGFKAPSLYQLFTPRIVSWWGIFGGGNRALRPEKSISYEYGVDQYLFSDKVIATVTYFHSVYKDLIDALYHPDTGNTDQYSNFGKATVHGIEVSGKVTPTDRLMARSGVTFLATKNLQTDGELLRRPRWQFFAECSVRPVDKLSIDMLVRYNGPMADAGGYKVKEYVVADLIVELEITKNFSAYIKALNIFDQKYEEVVGYTALPATVYGGIKAQF